MKILKVYQVKQYFYYFQNILKSHIILYEYLDDMEIIYVYDHKFNILYIVKPYLTKKPNNVQFLTNFEYKIYNFRNWLGNLKSDPSFKISKLLDIFFGDVYFIYKGMNVILVLILSKRFMKSLSLWI